MTRQRVGFLVTLLTGLVLSDIDTGSGQVSAAGESEAAKKELARFQGTWLVHKLTYPEKNQTMPGIYRFDGDVLSIATDFGREERKSFEDKAGLFIVVLKNPSGK